MSEEQAATRSGLLSLTTEIVTAHLSNNPASSSDVPGLIQTVFDTLTALARDEKPAPVELTPAVPIKRSVTDDYIVCLEDGKRLKMLKRHLMTDHGLTPEAYRAKGGLRADYPMVAPNYSAQRQKLAKQSGLGRKPAPPLPAPEPKPKRRRKQADQGDASTS